MTGLLPARVIGQPLERADGMAKVTGTATYAAEHPVPGLTHLHPVQATIARGRVSAVDTAQAEALDGVIAVLTPANAPRLASTEDPELAVLQSDEVAFRGQVIGAVVATTPEIARHAAGLVQVSYVEQPHDVALRPDRADLYAPDKVNPAFPTDTEQGDVPSALADAAVRLDQTYTTAWYHNNPMEPHATIASWDGGDLTLHDSTQGVTAVRDTVAPVLGVAPERVRVICPHVGGGFGSKGQPHVHLVLAALAAKAVGRPVRLVVTRQQMFALVGYRTPTIQRIRMGADRTGRLTAISVDVVEQTSRIKEFAEQTAVPARMMYAAPHRRTTHRLAALDVPVPSWMRAPGECPGMFGLETAVDEMAAACGLDPIEFRVRNEPERDPETGRPFSSRNLVACLREGARRFGWAHRDPTPRARREAGWLVGTGVAASTYPAGRIAGSSVTIRFGPDRRYQVETAAADLGTGTWTALRQIAADALGVDYAEVDLRIGDTALPPASVAGGSTGIASWGSAVLDAAEAFRDKFGANPSEGDEASGGMPDNPHTERYAMHAFGAQFAEVRVREDTGEIRVSRLLGVFAAGRIVNPRTARSQFIGGMTMGLSMALHEQSVLDQRFGHIVNHDLAEYHIAANADVAELEAHWIDEHDPYVNPLGTKGIGEIGIVGTAAAISNAAHHATGVRVRDLPITLDKFLS
ncbi:xanthine dehydrogenase family protein molybdopterin-binding subunit [Goodfellowiella coeruleoviolacea]|uniref:Xanthine dehydrogenase, molybdenum binding subunit apoprotein n=1 Tax=Goodfellowiella coeruleoviolacea TaxID=334858 RepID=A0AAE3GGE7_9PSEU|nr:xanthine dehydrogenase family protein molybdopterin-binding subunit [Goodfellowiella coeruleoviolacea]MCP2167193.1 xanthine dehydrogenase, molybdenum binding subunit apoprotein (EC 1.17.1.4) [Goodfellowiella coeruleoviolacea]